MANLLHFKPSVRTLGLIRYVVRVLIDNNLSALALLYIDLERHDPTFYGDGQSEVEHPQKLPDKSLYQCHLGRYFPAHRARGHMIQRT